MILRTPPPPKRPRADAYAGADVEVNRQLIIYEDPPESSEDPPVSEHMLCTYQCRQMVSFSLSHSNVMLCVRYTYFFFFFAFFFVATCTHAQVKSDFLDALSKAENQVRDYQSQLETLNHNFQKVGACRAAYVYSAFSFNHLLEQYYLIFL
jgi:mitotic spindle assembly checkpoint protein MAD1